MILVASRLIARAGREERAFLSRSEVSHYLFVVMLVAKPVDCESWT